MQFPNAIINTIDSIATLSEVVVKRAIADTKLCIECAKADSKAVAEAVKPHARAFAIKALDAAIEHLPYIFDEIEAGGDELWTLGVEVRQALHERGFDLFSINNAPQGFEFHGWGLMVEPEAVAVPVEVVEPQVLAPSVDWSEISHGLGQIAAESALSAWAADVDPWDAKAEALQTIGNMMAAVDLLMDLCSPEPKLLCPAMDLGVSVDRQAELQRDRLSHQTKRDLLELAYERGLDVNKAMRKAEIIAALV